MSLLEEELPPADLVEPLLVVAELPPALDVLLLLDDEPPRLVPLASVGLLLPQATRQSGVLVMVRTRSDRRSMGMDGKPQI